LKFHLPIKKASRRGSRARLFMFMLIFIAGRPSCGGMTPIIISSPSEGNPARLKILPIAPMLK